MKIASITFLTFGKWWCNYFLGAKECILQMASDSGGFGFPFTVIVYFFFQFFTNEAEDSGALEGSQKGG